MFRLSLKIMMNFFGLFLIFFAFWTQYNFDLVSVDQVLSIVLLNYQDLMDANHNFTISFVICCLLLPSFICLFLGIFPGLYQRVNIIFIVIGLFLIAYQYKIVDYLIYQSKKDYFSKNYINPRNTRLSSEKTKNLILIYVESLETTYSNSNIFHTDLLKSLTSLSLNHINYLHYHEMPGTDWSIAGVIATQCGIPLKLNQRLVRTSTPEGFSHVLPNAICLGDILAEKGYKNIYMNGSRLSFAGFGNFFKDHHYHEIYGREKWIRSKILNTRDMTSWGLPDDRLLDLAKIRVSQLMKNEQPFNLTLFMIDTHGVSGQLSRTCANAGYSTFEGIVQCTADQVADFIYYIDKNGWLDKINIVVIGDHLAMKNVVSNKLTSSDKRYIFNMIISKQKLIKNTEDIVAFDIFPTILTSLGFNFTDGKLGLGYTALGPIHHDKPQNRIKTLKENLSYDSEMYRQLWN